MCRKVGAIDWHLMEDSTMSSNPTGDPVSEAVDTADLGPTGETVEVPAEALDGLYEPQLFIVLRDADEETEILASVTEPEAGVYELRQVQPASDGDEA